MHTLLIVEGMILSALVFAYGVKVLISVISDGRESFADAVVISVGWLALMLIGMLSLIYGLSKIFG